LAVLHACKANAVPDITFAAQWGLPNNAATETLGNALRLFRDARLLFKNERYPSCVSISVLAIEELAKFMALVGYQPLSRSEWHVHTVKHLKPPSFVMGKRFEAALREIIAHRQMSADDVDAVYKRLAKFKHELRAADNKPVGKGGLGPPDLEKVGELSPEDVELFMAAFDKIVADGSMRRFVQAYTKQPEKLKKRGFYVDIGANMKVLSSPAEITHDIAKDHLDLVRDVFTTLIEQMEDEPMLRS
jgi:AbiV family abortive infection protein